MTWCGSLHYPLPWEQSRISGKGVTLVSLRTVHLVFILAAIVVAEMFGAWSIFHYPETADRLSLGLGIFTLIAGLALCVYAYHFVKRMDAKGIR
jgi:predicted transporter